ncbi:MAG: efflux RND transporter periplasmic adaptor subunit [Gemmatimonadetes bacterium]|nr:efflux RND transporter periplasmic adaptor subunit [Gemmatimonadota bacterium]
MRDLRLSIAAAVMLAVAPARAQHDEHDHDHDHDHGAVPTAGSDDHADHEEHEDEHGSEAIRLGPDLRDELGITLAAAGPGEIERSVSLPGEVRPNADRLAHLVPRYAGIVKEVRAKVGDRVQAGQVLAIVESDESLATFELRTALAGTVIGRHLSRGEAISRDRDAFVVADLSTVWVELAVFQRDLAHVRIGQDVRILVGHEPRPDRGRIDYVTPILDEATRTATARVVLDNARGDWRPGMFVTGLVEIERTEVPLALPRSAIHRHEGDDVVFVETEDGFAPRAVKLGRLGEDRVEIVEGLTAGTTYVATGGFAIKAELEKGSFGHGHAH